MELNKLQSIWNWGKAAAALNANFEKLKQELLKLRYASILTLCKGYFSTEARLLKKHPIGKNGEYAFVGLPWPGTVYEWTDDKWVNTFMVPQLGDSIFTELLKQFIDNDTIYWDAQDKVIKAKGGGSGTVITYTITVGINNADVDKCKVNATGAVVSITPSNDDTSYTIVANAGGAVKVQIIPESGFQVKILNVDKLPIGAVSEYTFENIDSDHTMYVWMDIADIIPTEYLVRSDMPGMYYSSTKDALNAVKATYPDGLTRDVTISCIKPAKESRTSGAWLASLANWNKGSVYMLTIDGADKLIYNCKSGGGLRFDHVDHVVCRNIDFVNFANGIEYPSPDELSAIAFVGDAENYSQNLYVDSCRMDGNGASQDSRKATYTVITKNAENVYLCGNRIENCRAIALKMVDCHWLSLIKNYVKADVSYGIIGHPALCTLSNSYGLIAEDNEFTGSTGEYFFSLVNVDRVVFRRNKFIDGGGEALNMASKTPMKELTLDNNLFKNMLSAPSVAWAYHYVIFSCNIEKVNVINNTAFMSGKQWQQWFLRGQNTHIGTLKVYNNILTDATGSSTPIYGIMVGDVDNLRSGNNLYQLKLKSAGVARVGFFAATGLTSTNSLAALQLQGVEVNSNLVGIDETILDNNCKLLPGLGYDSDAGHLAVADIEYKAPAAGGNSRGCYNLAGMAISEETDATTGYDGEDLSEKKAFTHMARYSTFAESLLLLSHKTLNRRKFIRLSAIGTQHKYLMLGRYGLIHTMPELDDNGEYKADELYSIKID